MEATMNNISRKEHLLAEKARDILEHQQQLESLKVQKEELQQQKPTAEKKQLSYQESLEFGKQVKQYEEKVQHVEVQIQKVSRELNALKKQAKKLLPVSNVNVKVSTRSKDDDMPSQTYCVKYIKKEENTQSEEYFDIERLQ